MGENKIVWKSTMITTISLGVVSIIGMLGIVIGMLIGKNPITVLMWYLFFMIIAIISFDQIQDIVTIGVGFL